MKLPLPVPLQYRKEKIYSYFSDPLTYIIWQSMLVAGVLIYGSHSVLINLCKVDGRIPFSSASVVLLIELAKLLFSFSFLLPEFKRGHKLPLPGPKTVLTFCVPAFLYCINNNLVVHIQLYLDPASFQVLSNMKIVTTAVLYKLIIKRHIPMKQWISLGLITIGGFTNSYAGIINDHNDEEIRESMDRTSHLPHQIFVTFFGVILMLMYCTISGLAGVYTEYILKRQHKLSLHLQNTMLYIFGVFFNFWAYMLESMPGDAHSAHVSGRRSSSSSSTGFFSGYSGLTVLIIVTQAANGLIMSVVMKHASNITRLLVIACAMIVTTILSVFLLSLQLNFHFLLAFLLVVTALWLYHN